MSGDRPGLSGPFDIVGDVHGCVRELRSLLGRVGWRVEGESVEHPDGRTAVFVGDLVDRGPSSVEVLRLVMAMVEAGTALAVPGNHDVRLAERLLAGPNRADRSTTVGLAGVERQSPAFRARVARFVGELPGHLRLDGGRLIVAHAGLRESLHGDFSETSRRLAIFGEHSGAGPGGKLMRRDWAADYRGRALVVHGHTRVREPRWRNRTIDIDTGCAKGGRLTALRYPELELVSVPAEWRYTEADEATTESRDEVVMA
jgi:protein phosphatase